MNCCNCKTSCEKTLLVPKPKYFTYKNESFINVEAFTDKELICLVCLMEKLNINKELAEGLL